MITNIGKMPTILIFNGPHRTRPKPEYARLLPGIQLTPTNSNNKIQIHWNNLKENK
jgi:hypothetical protein